MRNVHKALTFLGLIAFGAAAQGVACANTVEDCALIGEACDGQTPQGASSSGTGGSGGGALCDQHPKDNPGAIADECGVFVKTGVAGGEGTKASPLGTVQAAIAKATESSKKRVYACIGAFTESVSVPAGMSLFGGLDCAKDWAATAQRSTLKGTADKIPLTLQGDGSSETRIEAWNIEAADATAPGGSSIAAIAQDTAVVRFESSSLTAGRGANGPDGESASSMAPLQPVKSANGNQACMTANVNLGGMYNQNTCEPENPEVPETSIGGDGGNGNVAFGSAGQPGQAEPPPMDSKGTAGQPGLSNCAMGGDGGNGADGADGEAGLGGTAKGTLSPELGLIGASGGNGKKGLPGQGGGGGGGQKGKSAMPPTKPTACAGASGGAGGAGGCGGLGGKGGVAGGSSIALVSINATISMVGVKLTTSKGGLGGAGGSSQPGALGGLGGAGGVGMTVELVTMYPACKGGNGGNGGRGGPGGGGSGGHSIGIAYSGAAPTADMTTFDVPTDGGGMGGTGGDGNANNNFGASGLAIETLAF
jgi:hypothetical protein